MGSEENKVESLEYISELGGFFNFTALLSLTFIGNTVKNFRRKASGKVGKEFF